MCDGNFPDKHTRSDQILTGIFFHPAGPISIGRYSGTAKIKISRGKMKGKNKKKGVKSSKMEQNLIKKWRKKKRNDEEKGKKMKEEIGKN